VQVLAPAAVGIVLFGWLAGASGLRKPRDRCEIIVSVAIRENRIKSHLPVCSLWV
jgi:hypothetical protein